MASKTQESPILLLIDLQHGLIEGAPEWGPRSTPELVENVKYLLKTWRAKSWPVLHVQHDELLEPDHPLQPKYPETFALHASAAPEGDEKVFVKHVGSPFVATELPEAIKSYGHRKIVVIGMDGTQCINNTVRHGADLGYDMVVVADACSSYGIEDYTGKQVGAEESHKAAISMLAAFGKVTTTVKVLTDLGY